MRRNVIHIHVHTCIHTCSYVHSHTYTWADTAGDPFGFEVQTHHSIDLFVRFCGTFILKSFDCTRVIISVRIERPFEMHSFLEVRNA